MGKWTSLKGKYPKVAVDADYQAKIDAVLDSPAPGAEQAECDLVPKTRVRDLTDTQLKDLYNAARERLDELALEKAVLDLEEEAYTRLFVDRFEDEGVSNKTFADGTMLSLSDGPLPVVKDRDALLKWAEGQEGGREALLQFAAGKLSSLVKSCLEEGTPLPPGCDVFMKTSITRPKKAK